MRFLFCMDTVLFLSMNTSFIAHLYVFSVFVKTAYHKTPDSSTLFLPAALMRNTFSASLLKNRPLISGAIFLIRMNYNFRRILSPLIA